VERLRRETPAGWQAVVETPREEDRRFRLGDVRKSQPVELHTGIVPDARRNSH
jgi:hypothetical protein